jgi:hypothetical protein
MCSMIGCRRNWSPPSSTVRWAVEVAFQEPRRHLGFETQRQWSDQASHRAMPLLLNMFSLVTLWVAELAAKAEKLKVLGAAW